MQHSHLPLAQVPANWVHPDLKRQIWERERRRLHDRVSILNAYNNNIMEQVKVIDKVHNERENQVAMLKRTLFLLELEMKRITDLQNAAHNIQEQLHHQVEQYTSETSNCVASPTSVLHYPSSSEEASVRTKYITCALENTITKLSECNHHNYQSRINQNYDSKGENDLTEEVKYHHHCYLQLLPFALIAQCTQVTACQCSLIQEQQQKDIERFLSCYAPIFTWNAQRQRVEPPCFTSEPCLLECLCENKEHTTTLPSLLLSEEKEKGKNNKKRERENANDSNQNENCTVMTSLHKSEVETNLVGVNVSSCQLAEIKNNVCHNIRCLHWHNNQWNRIYQMLRDVLIALSSCHTSNSALCAVAKFTSEQFHKLCATHDKVSELCLVGSDLLSRCIYLNWHNYLTHMHNEKKAQPITNTTKKKYNLISDCTFPQQENLNEELKCKQLKTLKSNSKPNDCSTNIFQESEHHWLRGKSEENTCKWLAPILVVENDKETCKSYLEKSEEETEQETIKESTVSTSATITKEEIRQQSLQCEFEEIIQNVTNAQNKVKMSSHTMVSACMHLMRKLSTYLMTFSFKHPDNSDNEKSNEINSNKMKEEEEEWVQHIPQKVAYLIALMVVQFDQQHETQHALELLSSVLQLYLPSVAEHEVKLNSVDCNNVQQKLVCNYVLLSPVALSNLTLMFIVLRRFRTLGHDAWQMLPLTTISDILLTITPDSISCKNENAVEDDNTCVILQECLQVVSDYKTIITNKWNCKEIEANLQICLVYEQARRECSNMNNNNNNNTSLTATIFTRCAIDMLATWYLQKMQHQSCNSMSLNLLFFEVICQIQLSKGPCAGEEIDKLNKEELHVNEGAFTQLPLLRLLLKWQSRKDEEIRCDNVDRHTTNVAKLEERSEEEEVRQQKENYGAIVGEIMVCLVEINKLQNNVKECDRHKHLVNKVNVGVIGNNTCAVCNECNEQEHLFQQKHEYSLQFANLFHSLQTKFTPIEIIALILLSVEELDNTEVEEQQFLQTLLEEVFGITQNFNVVLFVCIAQVRLAIRRNTVENFITCIDLVLQKLRSKEQQEEFASLAREQNGEHTLTLSHVVVLFIYQHLPFWTSSLQMDNVDNFVMCNSWRRELLLIGQRHNVLNPLLKLNSQNVEEYEEFCQELQ